ncbi:MAG: hypothetical protein DRP02_02345 [Candidatus Gerdarchaeota archaeon]|nr:MAG: hypothetical protein DRP02_02345 [Candidatus Gerdarchaeota archaeon]
MNIDSKNALKVCNFDGGVHYIIGEQKGISDKHTSVFITKGFTNISKETFLKHNPKFNDQSK